ncbi:MAG TPA: BLUF domain-containing protein [Allosphingosinicella sp.]|jgi:hypothetical protein
MISLLYVSRAALQPGSEGEQIDDILAVARERNAKVGVTGALILDGGCFAQLLEGEAPAVNQLMIDILRDRRHSEVRILEVTSIAERRFGGRAMALVACAPEPRGHLEALARAGTDAETGAAVRGLVEYMARCAEAPERRG